MVSTREAAQSFSLEGEVVEILQEVKGLRVKVLLRPGTVLDVAVKAQDVHLGDRIGIDGSLRVEQLRTHVEVDGTT